MIGASIGISLISVSSLPVANGSKQTRNCSCGRSSLLDITELPSPSPPANATNCPNCGGGFELAAERLRLGTILERWRNEAGVIFSAAALCDYGGMLERVLTFRRCRECRFGMFDPAIPGTAAFYSDILAKEHLY